MGHIYLLLLMCSDIFYCGQYILNILNYNIFLQRMLSSVLADDKLLADPLDPMETRL